MIPAAEGNLLTAILKFGDDGPLQPALLPATVNTKGVVADMEKLAVMFGVLIPVAIVAR